MSHLPVWEEVALQGRTLSHCYQEARTRYAPEQEAYRKAAGYVKEYLPQAARDILAQAHEFLEGRMILCGTMGKPYFVGNPPRWSDNPVGDAEYVFMLNRMEHWPILLQAYYLTGDSVYAQKVVSELENWINTCPPLEISLDFSVAKPRFDAATPWRTLELGIRPTRSWNLVLQLLAGTPCFSEEIYCKMMLSLFEHAQILYHVCPVLWPRADHNHYLTECLGLLEISCLCDFMEQAPVWRKHALRELERCAENQILPGGGQIEGAPNYHNECLFQMTYSIQLARRYGFSFSRHYEDLVHSMLLRSIYTTRPDGVEVPWGDSDATPLIFRSAFCHYKAFEEPEALQIVAGAFGKEGLLCEFDHQVWSLRDAPTTAKWLSELKPTEPLIPTFLHDREFKQVMARTGWNAAADSIFFSARSPIHNDHAHIDPNAFEYFSHGFAVLPDAGRYTYREGGDRHYYKSTEAHNTLTVNGRDAFAYLGTWAYGGQQAGGILAAEQCGTFSYACGFHENYAPAVHRRALILSKDCLFVFDAVDGLSSQDIVSDYFLFDTTSCSLLPGIFRAVSPDNRLVSTLSFCGNTFSAVLPGRLSETVDHERPARRLCLTADGKNVQRILSVICCRPLQQEIAARKLSVEESADAFFLNAYVEEKMHSYHIDKSSWVITSQN